MDADEGPLAAGPASAESVASRAVTGELQGLLPAGIAERAAASESSIKKDEDQDGLGVQMGVRHLFQGAVGDWRRRFRHQITSDYLDGCRSQTLSAGLFTFFGVLATTISLGNRIQQTSGGQTGFLEYMLMNSAAGVIYATIEAQPYVVVQPTGPVTMLLEMLCEHAAEMHFEFLPFVAATGLFVGMWLILASACNVSGMIHYMSRFTGEVFAVFIGTAYMKDGIDGLVARFGERRTGPTRQALLGNDTNTGDALMSLNIGLLVLGLAYWLAKGLHGPRLCPTPFRQFLSAYSLTISIVVATLLCHFVVGRHFTITYLAVPDQPGGTSLTLPTRILTDRYSQYVFRTYDASHYPNGTSIPGSSYAGPPPDPRPAWMDLANASGGHALDETWWVGLPDLATQWHVYLWGLLYSIPIVIFFLVDQLVSSGLAQPSELRLLKGRYYHSGLLLVGVLNIVGPLLGLPFVTGALPQSPELTIQMAETAAESSTRLEAELAATKVKADVERTGDTEAAAAAKRTSTRGLAASLLGGGGKPAAAKPANTPPAPAPASVADLDRRPVVIETRLAPLLAYLLIFGAFMVPDAINVLPAAAMEGTLIYIGATGILNTQLFQRVLLMLSDWRQLADGPSFATEVTPGRMHLYTSLQLGAIALAWAIQCLPPTIGLVFPLWIISLVPLRIYVLPHLFTAAELRALDPGSDRLDALYSVRAEAVTEYGSFEAVTR